MLKAMIKDLPCQRLLQKIKAYGVAGIFEWKIDWIMENKMQVIINVFSLSKHNVACRGDLYFHINIYINNFNG